MCLILLKWKFLVKDTTNILTNATVESFSSIKFVQSELRCAFHTRGQADFVT